MLNQGFLKVACVTPTLEVGNPLFNIKEITRLSNLAKSSITVFPELCISGYTCGDYFYQDSLLKDVYLAIDYFKNNNKNEGIVILGAPLICEGSLVNCAIVFSKNQILGVVPKRTLPNNHEFYEKRWFKSAKNLKSTSIYINEDFYPLGQILFHDWSHNIHFGIEICEDMWASITPANNLALHGANMTINLSASNEVLGKSEIRRNSVLENSRRNCGAYIYASAGVNESTSDTVYSGHNIIAVCGNLLKEAENFSMTSEIIYADIDINMIEFNRRNQTDMHDDINGNYVYQEVDFNLIESENYCFEEDLDSTPFVPKKDELKAFNKIASLQEYALYKRLKHTNAKTLVIGVSGGLDSTLALLVAVEAFKHLNYDLKGIIAVTMPGLGTSDRTKNNALSMMEKLGITVLVKPIKDAVLQHFKDIEHDINLKDVTYENAQARIRTLILMDLANKYNGLVLGTGDMSELALGWCTYNGDQMSMYGINAGVPKTLVRFMIKYYALTKFKELSTVLEDIIATPISPELLDTDQKTEDSIGKYEINDFILYRYLNCGDDELRMIYLLKLVFKLNEEEATKYVKNFFFRFFTQQFKRQATPDGPKILNVSLAPRGDYRMPSDIKRW